MSSQPPRRVAHELSPLHRDGKGPSARQMGATAIRSILGAAAFITGFYFWPFDGGADGPGIVRFLVVVAVVAVVVVLQLRGIVSAPFPWLRAVEALALTVTVVVVCFAAVYYGLSRADPRAFTEPLDHTDALYYTVTTLATVGYGDIAPVTTSARVAAMVNMAANVAVLGASIKLILGTARRRAEAEEQ